MPSPGLIYCRAANLPSANMAGGVTTNQMVLDSRGNVLAFQLPTNGSLDSVPFIINVYGHSFGFPAGGRSVTVQMRLGNSSTLANNPIVATAGTHAIIPPNLNLLWQINCFWNGQNTTLGGYSQGVTGGTNIAFGSITSTSIDPNQDSNLQSSAPVFLSLSTTITATVAGDQFYIDAFDLRV